MGSHSKEIVWTEQDWSSSQSRVLLNSRLPTEEKTKLLRLTDEFALPGHVWIASSGSTASQDQSVKLIALRKEALLTSAQAVNRHLSITSEDVWGLALPLFHVGGLGIMARGFLAGTKVVQLLEEGAWSPERFYQKLIKHEVTATALVPTQLFDLLQKRWPCPENLRAVVIGGAALPDGIYEEAIRAGWPILPSYGMTECCSQVATASLQGLKKSDRRMVRLPHVQVRVSKQGHFEVNSDSLLTGYAQWKGKKAHFIDPKVDGWFETSDRGVIEGDFVLPIGRDSDFVKISGEGVNLNRLNAVLESIVQILSPHAIGEIVVAAAPDPRTENKIILVVGNALITSDQIREVILRFDRSVAPFEKIRGQKYLKAIPRSPLGKILWKKI